MENNSMDGRLSRYLQGMPSLNSRGYGEIELESRQADIENKLRLSLRSQELVDTVQDTVPTEPVLEGASESQSQESEGLGFFDRISKLIDMPTIIGTKPNFSFSRKRDESDSSQSDLIQNVWALTNVQGHSVNLSKKQEELRSSEGKWIPEINAAKEYVSQKMQLLDLTRSLQEQNINRTMTDSQLNSLVNEIEATSSRVSNLEPQVKEAGRRNPYLQDIFYETKRMPLNKFEEFNTFGQAMKYITYDWLRAGSEFDMNPENNYKHMLEDNGLNWGKGLTTHRLSNQLVNRMWDLKNSNTTANLQKQLDLLQEYGTTADKQMFEKEQDIIAKINTIKNGNWMFDPTKINPEFKKKFENNDIKVDDPNSWIYAMPHLGSSYSEFGAMLGQIGASMLINSAAKGAIAVGTGGTAPLLMATGEAAINLAIANYMRQSETSAEVFDAYLTRVLNAVENSNLNLPAIVEDSQKKLSQLGYPVLDMSDYEIFAASIAQNLRSGDPLYDNILKESEKGLDVIRQTNQALSIPDYLESTMFAYGGKWLSDSYGLRKTLGKMHSGAGFDQRMASSVSNRLLETEANNILDKTIVKAVNKIAKDPVTKVTAKHAVSTLSDIGKKMGISYFTERTEEGQQSIVKSRYLKGDYDNVENYSLLNGAANALLLGAEANAAYYGIHPDNTLNTDKDLINEMKIGGFTGLFMTSVYGSRDVIDGVSQFTTDGKLRGLVSDHYADAERDQKIKQILNVAEKGNASEYGRVKKSLASLKDFKPDGVTDEMIDADIKLVDNISGYTTNRKFNDVAKSVNAEKGTERYNRIVQNAIGLQDRTNEQSAAAKASTDELERIVQNAYASTEGTVFDDYIDSEYKRYVKNTKTKNTKARNKAKAQGQEDYTDAPIMERDAFKRSSIDQIVSAVTYTTVTNLLKELKAREGDLTKLKNELGLDVNVDGVRSINRYLDSQEAILKSYNKNKIDRARQLKMLGEDSEILENIVSQLPALPEQDDLTNALLSKFINDGALQGLIQHRNAYIFGEYYGDADNVNPKWKQLSESERNQILQDAAKEDLDNGIEPRSAYDVAKEYNEGVDRKIAADKESDSNLANDRAKAIIRRDLKLREDREKQATLELEQEYGTPAQDPVVTDELEIPKIEGLETETLIDTDEKPIDSMDPVSPIPGIETDEVRTDSNTERLLDKLEQESNPQLETDQLTIDESEADAFDQSDLIDNDQTIREEIALMEELDNQKLTDLNTDLQIENDAVETDGVDEVDPSENAVEEAFKEDELNVEEQKEEDAQDGVEETEEEQSPESSEFEPAPEKPAETPAVEVDDTIVPKIDPRDDNFYMDPNRVDAQDLFVDPATEKLMLDPSGMRDMDNAIEIDDMGMSLQFEFDSQDDPTLFGPSQRQNSTANTDPINPTETKDKQKFRHIADTFFYLPTTDEVMPLTVYGKPVTFTTKDGKVAKRAPGSKLSENLSIPGWLESADDIYYIVTSSKHDMNERQAIDNLAVHMIIEKDGFVYNTSLRAITDKLRDELQQILMSPADIDDQINKLRILRTSIIKAYAPNYLNESSPQYKFLPTEVYKHAKPTGISQSNGTLNNQTNDAGLPVYRSLTLVREFEASSDPQVLTDQLNDPDKGLEIGFGVGPLAFNYEPFQIVRMDLSGLTSVQGRGYAGKLYLIPKRLNTPSKKHTLPIMLSEELHRIDGVSRWEDVQLSRNAKGVINRDANGKAIRMSTAELIFQLMTDVVISPSVDDFLLSILANAGPLTSTAGFDQSDNATYNFLVRKQLYIWKDGDNRVFINARMKTPNAPQYGYETKYTDLNKLNDTQKKRIIFEISQNIHWNTDKEVFFREFPTDFVEAIVESVRRKPDLSPTDSTPLSIGGSVLTFTLRDLGYTIENGAPVQLPGTKPIVGAWAINHQIIKTDLGEHAFTAPFVFATGVRVDDGQKPAVATKVVDKNNKVVSEKTPEKPQAKKQAPTTGKTVTKGTVQGIPATTENLAQYNLQIPKGQKLVAGWGWAILPDKKTGEMKVLQVPKQHIGGVFSTVRGSGLMNRERAIQWLVDYLGVSPDQVDVLNAVFSTMNDGQIYGLLTTSVNSIANEIMPMFRLSSQAGAGIEYHEAFHYVSLLLLDENSRRKVYNEYRSRQQDENMSDQDVEEMLAEEFRKFMLDELRGGLRYNVLKFFRTLKNYILSLFGKKSLTNQLFGMIANKEFVGRKPTQQILIDFYNAHPEGVTYYIPGLSQEELRNMENIPDDTTFYKTVNSLMSTSLAMFNIRNERDVSNLDLNLLFDNMESQLEYGFIDEANEALVRDVIENKEVFKRFIVRKLNQLNIRVDYTQESEESNKLQTETGDNPDNSWDKNQGDISKKYNIAFKAKLFFYSIPKYEFQYVTDENGNVTRELVPMQDDIFKFPLTHPFNEVWNQIMENLWDIDSYADIVSESLRLGLTDPFFYALHEMLTSEDNPISDNDKTQLEVTIKSAKLQMTTIDVSHEQPKFPPRSSQPSDEEIQDAIDRSLKTSVWQLLDSDSLRKIARLPARWSRAFYSSEWVEQEGNKKVLNKAAVKNLKQLRDKITSNINQINKHKGDLKDGELRLAEMQDAFIQIANNLKIPFDLKSLDYMLNEFSDKRPTTIPRLNQFINFWNSPDKSLSFATTVSNILAMGDKGTITIGGRNKGVSRTADRIFNYSNPQHLINRMAVAYGKMHPSPQEFSVTGADGALIYPISENNYMTDQIRDLNKNLNGKRELLLNTPYSKRSLLANNPDTTFKLHTFLALNIEDASNDYFGISPLEDYIAKLTLTFNDHLTLPTMSDKKTWYSISGLNLQKNVIVSKGSDAISTVFESLQDGEQGTQNILINRRFNNETLDIFVNYFLDEFEAVFDYYAKKDFVQKNPTLRVDNYHGKIKNGKMDDTGNGGRFRYFSNLRMSNGDIINVNQDLSKIEKTGDLEGSINYLKNLKVLLLNKTEVNSKEPITHTSPIYDVVNNILVGATNREMKKLVDLGVVRFTGGYYQNKLIPTNIYKFYDDLISNKLYEKGETLLRSEDVLFSIIGSHVANTAISINELEKCFTGDPAYYKWQKTASEDKTFDLITGRDVDKIKRLSAVLSTGTNLRTIFDSVQDSDTNITVMHLKDNEIGSSYESELRGFFRNSILVDLQSQNHPEWSDSELISSLDTAEKEQKFFDSLTKAQKKFVEDYTNASVNPYSYRKDKDGKITGGNINQADAAVYIRPALYRKIMRALGEWSEEIERAYDIMENPDESWLNDPQLYSQTLSALMKPLKMLYFGDHLDMKLGLNIPVFDKMAIFPMFRVLAKADNKLLYDRMNNEDLGVIDMITFESAVKVGGRLKFNSYKDATNETFNIEDLNKPSFSKTGKEGDLATYTQDIRNLRLQLNTDPHEHTDRSFGTQAAKICLANIVDDRTYGENKGISKTGSDVKNETMSAIDALTMKGASKVLRRFYKDGSINYQVLSDYLVDQAISTNMSQEFIEGLKIGQDGQFVVPLAASSNRRWIESRVISYINKQVVDINTPGGTAIQMASYGFKATGARTQSAFGNAFNNGKSLKFLKKNGSIEVMISTNFFRHVVPQEYQTSFGAMRQWLFDNNIIGPDANPQGVGYRIPTQGLSSTFSYNVVDVIPDRFGDTIIVPDEFTAMTGSDFDVDKLFIATLNYDENGNIIQFAVDEEGNELPERKQSVEALQNRIILNYQLIISDNKNMAETRASIDTLTKILQNDVLPVVDPKVKREALPFYELLPSFQSDRKKEYTGGKAGIGPFALNSTNHVLTQAVHLVMNYTNKNPYNLGELDAIKGRDGYRILDWLSAMINAHVDVAKDPYIMTLNVNQITYNMTNLLLRGGMGLNTFYFLAQPILKELANLQIVNRGTYGVVSKTENQIIADLYDKYATYLKQQITIMPQGLSKDLWISRYNGIADEIGLDPIVSNKELTAMPIDKSEVFNRDNLVSSLKNRNSLDAVYQNIIVLRAYSELSNDAKRLADLVHRSQIDTKKYGNTISQQMNFRNSYETFITEDGRYFQIRGVEYDSNNPQFALRKYFGDTFLGKKLHYGTKLPKKMLRSQLFSATQVFENLFTSTMRIFGTSKDVVYSNGKEAQGYKHVGDKKQVDRFAQYVESITRGRLTRNIPSLYANDTEINEMLFGSNTMCKRLTGIKEYILSNSENFPTLVESNGLQIKNLLLNYLQELPGDGTVQVIDRIILSDSMINIEEDVENALVSAFSELLDSNDQAVREFANDLAKYAWLTSYDERTVNGFFGLVPNSWKIQTGYVQKIKDALQAFKTNNPGISYQDIVEESDNAASAYFPSINISIARNMWQDDEVVPVFVPVFGENGDSRVLASGDITVKDKNLRVHNLFSTRVKGREFVKVQFGKGNYRNYQLYRLVGESGYQTEDGEFVNRGKRYIYQRIPKLGLLDNGFRVSEMLKSSLEPSAFSENDFKASDLLTAEEIETKALNALRAPKKDSGLSKIFVANAIDNIQTRLSSDSKSLSEIEAAEPVFDNIINVGETFEQNDAVDLTQELIDDVNEFVNIEIPNDFDMTDFNSFMTELIDDFSDMSSLLEETIFGGDSQMVDSPQETETLDMGGLIELGKKRKKECD